MPTAPPAKSPQTAGARNVPALPTEARANRPRGAKRETPTTGRAPQGPLHQLERTFPPKTNTAPLETLRRLKRSAHRMTSTAPPGHPRRLARTSHPRTSRVPPGRPQQVERTAHPRTRPASLPREGKGTEPRLKGRHPFSSEKWRLL